ncbi:hypothetical protein [Cupriavidus sp. D384]|uniref:hypothetical protein n=1 Tax=Cupriavidus sp. D384 TaxID=1538095 RepID=UPI000A692685|nr:hypothetical protein [Cupriavidus sp. D384]
MELRPSPKRISVTYINRRWHLVVLFDDNTASKPEVFETSIAAGHWSMKNHPGVSVHIGRPTKWRPAKQLHLP